MIAINDYLIIYYGDICISGPENEKRVALLPGEVQTLIRSEQP
jgi:hypothetical protein